MCSLSYARFVAFLPLIKWQRWYVSLIVKLIVFCSPSIRSSALSQLRLTVTVQGALGYFMLTVCSTFLSVASDSLVFFNYQIVLGEKQLKQCRGEKLLKCRHSVQASPENCWFSNALLLSQRSLVSRRISRLLKYSQLPGAGPGFPL